MEFFKQGFLGLIAILVLQYFNLMPSLNVLSNINGWTVLMFVVGSIILGAVIDVIVQKV